jgi:hypothetical protein
VAADVIDILTFVLSSMVGRNKMPYLLTEEVVASFPGQFADLGGDEIQGSLRA